MRVAVLASGSGTILEAILDAGIPVEVVIVDRPCLAVDRAESYLVTTELVERTDFTEGFDRHAHTNDVIDILNKYEIDLVVMAGFGTIVAPVIFEEYADRIINTHPALLPAFKGWHAVADALDAGVRITGTTVHVATVEVDEGPILAQEAVPVLPDDTVESLHERIKVVERRLYVQTIQDIINRGSVL